MGVYGESELEQILLEKAMQPGSIPTDRRPDTFNLYGDSVTPGQRAWNEAIIEKGRISPFGDGGPAVAFSQLCIKAKDILGCGRRIGRGSIFTSGHTMVSHRFALPLGHKILT